MTKLPTKIPKTDIVEKDTLDLMDLIADGALSETELPDLIEREAIINRTKLFLVAQAKTELKRIVRLTRLLDTLEERYEQRLEVEQYHMELDEYQKAIRTINTCIDRSNKLIKSIVNDEELTSILIVNNQSQVNNNIDITENKLVVEGLENPESRNRVVQAVDSILSQLKTKEEELQENE